MEATRLKVILISPWRSSAPGVVEVPISPFSQFDAAAFLAHIFPDLPLSHRTWLYDQFGGFPGLLLQGAVAFKEGIGPDVLQVPQYEAMLHAYESRMTRGLGPGMQALEVLSILPRFTLHANSTADLEAVCDMLGVDITTIFRKLDLLRARNLIEHAEFRAHGFFG